MLGDNRACQLPIVVGLTLPGPDSNQSRVQPARRSPRGLSPGFRPSDASRARPWCATTRKLDDYFA